jgi:hypothetical protein
MAINHNNDKYDELDSKITEVHGQSLQKASDTSSMSSKINSAITAAQAAHGGYTGNIDPYEDKHENTVIEKTWPAKRGYPKSPSDYPSQISKIDLLNRHIDYSDNEDRDLWRKGDGPQGESGIVFGQLMLERLKYVADLQKELRGLSIAVTDAKKALDKARSGLGNDSFEGVFTKIELDYSGGTINGFKEIDNERGFVPAYTKWLSLVSIQSAVFAIIKAEEYKIGNVPGFKYDKFIKEIKAGDVIRKTIKGVPLRGTDENYLTGKQYTYDQLSEGSDGTEIAEFSDLDKKIQKVINDNSSYVENYYKYSVNGAGGVSKLTSTIAAIQGVAAGGEESGIESTEATTQADPELADAVQQDHQRRQEEGESLESIQNNPSTARRGPNGEIIVDRPTRTEVVETSDEQVQQDGNTTTRTATSRVTSTTRSGGGSTTTRYEPPPSAPSTGGGGGGGGGGGTGGGY